MFSKFKNLEARINQQRVNMKAKLPEIERTLETVKFLQSKQVLLNNFFLSLMINIIYITKGSEEAITTTFELTYGIHLPAQIKKTNSVCLWLGVCPLANCSYNSLLTNNRPT